MSALPPKADMCSATRHVRFVPIADIAPVLAPSRTSEVALISCQQDVVAASIEPAGIVLRPSISRSSNIHIARVFTAQIFRDEGGKPCVDITACVSPFRWLVLW
jgi:hypothetical protein